MSTETPNESRSVDERELAYFCDQWEAWRCDNCHQRIAGSKYACTCHNAEIRRLRAALRAAEEERDQARAGQEEQARIIASICVNARRMQKQIDAARRALSLTPEQESEK